MRKNERGSITIYVLCSCLLILIILVSSFMRNQSKISSQKRQQQLIEEQYRADDQIDKAYEETLQNYLRLIEVQGLTIDDVEFTQTIEDWTNENIKVTVGLKDTVSLENNCVLQTSKDGVNWDNTLEQEFEQNGIIYVRIWNGAKAGNHIQKDIDKIDKLQPEDFEIASSNITTKSITVSVNAQDKSATQEDACSGIKDYRFSKDNGNTWSEYQTSETYIFDDLIGNVSGESYNIAVEVRDYAGNTKVQTESISTTKNDTYYIAAADQLIGTIGGRSYYKKNSEPAIVAMYYRTGNWSDPILVSTSKTAVTYYSTHDYSELNNTKSIEYKGTTFYYNSGYQSMNNTCVTTFPILNTTETRYDIATAAQALLDLYFQ